MDFPKSVEKLVDNEEHRATANAWWMELSNSSDPEAVKLQENISNDELFHWQPDEITDWLSDYIRGRTPDPPLVVPRSYPDTATYLLEQLGQIGDHEFGRKFGDATVRLLRKSLMMSEVCPPDGNFRLLNDLLFLLEGLPCSAPEDVTALLLKLKSDDAYKEWPSKDTDTYESILLALANHIVPGSHPLSAWISQFERDLENSGYAAAAYSVLLEVSILEAIPLLASVLRVLKQHKISPTNLLFGLAYHINEDLDLWNKVAVELSEDSEDKESIKILISVLNTLGYEKVVNLLEISLDSSQMERNYLYFKDFLFYEYRALWNQSTQDLPSGGGVDPSHYSSINPSLVSCIQHLL